MNLSKNTICISILAATIFLFAGCNKIYDYIKHHPGGIEDGCRIKFISNQYSGTTYTLSFEYNQLGNPVHIKSVPVLEGYPNRRFIYDNKNRLILYNGYYQDTTLFEYRISFYYDKQNRVTHDTGYFIGGYWDGEIYAASKRATRYEYDQYGRISKTIAQELLYESQPYTTIYEYDARGNLKYPGDGADYDNQTSLRRTHPLWMFLDRDYSVNNYFKASAYNKKGLPVRTNLSQIGYNTFLWWPIQNAELTWECK
ncbi:MAG: hypothetical protein J7578_02295 [Chitinophagaceae bacterium]|nr:hypothetical protein [Chitinophagaceae bacterium]